MNNIFSNLLGVSKQAHSEAVSKAVSKPEVERRRRPKWKPIGKPGPY